MGSPPPGWTHQDGEASPYLPLAWIPGLTELIFLLSLKRSTKNSQELCFFFSGYLSNEFFIGANVTEIARTEDTRSGSWMTLCGLNERVRVSHFVGELVGSQTEGGHGKSRSGRNKGEGTEDSSEKCRNKGRERVVRENEARLTAEFCGLGGGWRLRELGGIDWGGVN